MSEKQLERVAVKIRICFYRVEKSNCKWNVNNRKYNFPTKRMDPTRNQADPHQVQTSQIKIGVKYHGSKSCFK